MCVRYVFASSVVVTVLTVASKAPHLRPFTMGVVGGYIDTKRRALGDFIKVNIREVHFILTGARNAVGDAWRNLRYRKGSSFSGFLIL